MKTHSPAMAITTLILVFSIFPCVTLACSEIDESCCTDITSRLDKLVGTFSQFSDITSRLDKLVGMFSQFLTQQKAQQAEEIGIDWQDCYKGMASQGTYDPRVLVSLPGGKQALCDTQTDGGGWIIFQRRSNGEQDFFKTWLEYKTGFGDVKGGGDYWLGLQSLHELTSKEKYELRIDMVHEGGQASFAEYSSFWIESESRNFKLMIGSYSGNTTDNLTYHNNRPFSTYDRDNDEYQENCAQNYKGAWWYKHSISILCYRSNLNGVWGVTGKPYFSWGSSFTKLLTLIEMKMRRVS